MAGDLLRRMAWYGFILFACSAAVSMSAQAAGAMLAVAAWLAGVLFLGRRLTFPRENYFFHEAFLLAFTAAVVVSTAFSADPALSAKRLTVMLGEIACYFAAAGFPWNRKNALLAVNCLLVSGAVETVYALVQYGTGTRLLNFGPLLDEIRRFGPAYGTWDYYNALGGILSMIAPAGWFLAVYSETPRGKALYFTLAALVTAGLAASSSRGSFCGMIAALCAALLFERKARMLLPAAAVIACILLVPVARHRVFSAASGDVHRVVMWKTALNLMKEKPLTGIGLEGFSGRYKKAAGSYQERERLNFFHAHNIYLGLGAECGIPCLGLFVAFLAALSVFLVRLWRTFSDGSTKALFLGCLGAAVSLLAHGFFDYTLRGNTVYLFWIACGILSSDLFSRGPEKHEHTAS